MDPTRTLRDSDEADEWFREVARGDQGYVEVEVAGSGYPLLTFAFCQSMAVLHCFPSPGEARLLVGDGVVDEGQALEFPILNEPATFTGRFVSDFDRGRRLVLDSLRMGTVEGLGQWELL